MKALLLVFGMGILLSSCAKKSSTYSRLGWDDKQYKGQYYGNRSKDDLNGSVRNHPYVGGGYGWERDY